MEQAKIIPSNRGTPWTYDLDTKLVYAIANGKTIKDCEVCFQRTRGGITSRIMLIARRMVGKGIPIEAVSSILKTSISSINLSLRMSEISTENAQKRRDAKKELVKTNSDSATQTTTYTMEFTTTFSAEYLRGVFTSTRMKCLENIVNQLAQTVVQYASKGETSAMISSAIVDMHSRNSNDYKISTEDIVEGLRLKCPGCKVQYEEMWEPSRRNPNQMDKKAGITVDWS